MNVKRDFNKPGDLQPFARLLLSPNLADFNPLQKLIYKQLGGKKVTIPVLRIEGELPANLKADKDKLFYFEVGEQRHFSRLENFEMESQGHAITIGIDLSQIKDVQQLLDSFEVSRKFPITCKIFCENDQIDKWQLELEIVPFFCEKPDLREANNLVHGNKSAEAAVEHKISNSKARLFELVFINPAKLKFTNPIPASRLQLRVEDEGRAVTEGFYFEGEFGQGTGYNLSLLAVGKLYPVYVVIDFEKYDNPAVNKDLRIYIDQETREASGKSVWKNIFQGKVTVRPDSVKTELGAAARLAGDKNLLLNLRQKPVQNLKIEAPINWAIGAFVNIELLAFTLFNKARNLQPFGQVEIENFSLDFRLQDETGQMQSRKEWLKDYKEPPTSFPLPNGGNPFQLACRLPISHIYKALPDVILGEIQIQFSYKEVQEQAKINTGPHEVNLTVQFTLQGYTEKIILLIRKMGKVTDLTHLYDIAAQFPEGEKGILGETRRLREMIKDISDLQIRLNVSDRPIFREPIAQLLYKEIENFLYKISGFNEPLTSELRATAASWLKIAQKQLEEAKAKTSVIKEPSLQVFRAGDPAKRDQEAFVPRFNVFEALEKQIMLSTGCPGLVLYGRRRVGKSTILQNLYGFLPKTVIPVFISMQDPQAFTSLTGLLRLISDKVQTALASETASNEATKQDPQAFTSLTDLPRLISDKVQTALASETASNEAPNDLTHLFCMLTKYNEQLKEKDKRILLAIDEYENIDHKLGEKVFPKDLLAMVRESIQTHRQITWIFAGSHDITELKHAEWPSYLVSARTVEVPLFAFAETRMLLTEPLKYSSLWQKNDPKRPHFSPEFWGENGIERIQHEAGGWPHLVQLIAETIVDLINDETKRQVDVELFEHALNKAIISGHIVLYELMKGESILPGEWDYLAAFRKRELQPPPEDEAIYTSLRRRLLVEEANGEWRLRVPLMARWLKARG